MKLWRITAVDLVLGGWADPVQWSDGTYLDKRNRPDKITATGVKG